jgi:hypothetical protein
MASDACVARDPKRGRELGAIGGKSDGDRLPLEQRTAAIHPKADESAGDVGISGEDRDRLRDG